MEPQPNSYVSELKNELIEILEGVVLPEMSGVHEQCIYKVPQYIRQADPQDFTPKIISIGPFHNPHGSISDNNRLHEMEEFKLKYLKGFLNRTKLCVGDLVSKLQEWESQIRNCYAGLIGFDSKNFIKIIIIDACFIIEHFLRLHDPILLKEALFADIFHDLVLLENQLPFFILEEIYKLANINPQLPSFITITINHFQLFRIKKIDLETLKCQPKHFTDLLRAFLLPSFYFAPQETDYRDYATQHVYSVSQLSEAGLKFELSESKCLLDLEFDKGVLKMPSFHVLAFTKTHIKNMIAFEECHFAKPNSSAYISQYVFILNSLINTEKDVSILADKKIIVNWMGDGNEAATMVNKLCKNILVSKLHPKYLSLCDGLNGFYENPRNKYKAIFVHEYFNTPWKIASTIAAVLLLLFTLIQTVCSIWSLVK